MSEPVSLTQLRGLALRMVECEAIWDDDALADLWNESPRDWLIAVDAHRIGISGCRDVLARTSGAHLARVRHGPKGPEALRAWSQHSYYRGGAYAMQAVLDLDITVEG